MKYFLFFCVFIGLFTVAITTRTSLPHYGEAKVHFSLTDQTGARVSEADMAGKVCVVDFFFTSCPTICPRMSGEMVRIHDAFLQENRVLLLSYSIDPAHDSVSVLREYATRLGADSRRWRLLTGPQDSIYALAKPLLAYAHVGTRVYPQTDASAPGGHVHDGNFVLLDTKGVIRGYYDGTNPEKIDQLMKDMKRLLEE